MDLHNDVITEMDDEKFLKYIADVERNGVDVVLLSIWTTRMVNPLNEIRMARQKIDNIETSVKLLLHVEDAWFINEQNLDELVSLRPFSVGITWNSDNDLAGGAYGEGDLTNLGRIVIKRLVQEGIAIDVAHLNRKSFHSVINFIKPLDAKVFCSHTCIDYVNPHPRNLDDAQIKELINMDGIIGLTLVGDFLNSDNVARMNDVYCHIQCFIEKFGSDNLAIGTDFFGTANLPKGLNGYKDFKKLKRFFVKKGLSVETIDKIFYLNAWRFVSYI
ncbi:MAG: dipeptidase [Firmicutes bacterium]|nr:dipeptidase [Bacillota bacterium]